MLLNSRIQFLDLVLRSTRRSRRAIAMRDDNNSSIANVGASCPNSIVRVVINDDVTISLEDEIIIPVLAIGVACPDNSAATVNY